MSWYAKIVCLIKGHDWKWRPLSLGHVCKRCGKLKMGDWEVRD